MNTVLVVLGAPGAGKSVLIRSLPFSRRLHVGESAKALSLAGAGPSLRNDWEQIVSTWDLSGRVVLDGFPRSPEQTEWLLSRVELSRIRVLWLPLDRDCSVRSQCYRDGDSPRYERAQQKYDRYLERDVPAMAALKSAGAVYLHLTRRSPELMVEETLRFLGHDVQNMAWDWEGLVAVDRALSGIPWRFVHGSVYRPVFASLGAGAPCYGNDLDIQVSTADLETARTRVQAVLGRKISVHDQTTKGVPWERAVSLLHLRVTARLAGGRIRLDGDPAALEALLTGQLVPLDPVRGPAKAARILEVFPGLRGAFTPVPPVRGRMVPREESAIASRVLALASVLRRDIPQAPMFARPGSRPLLRLEVALEADDQTWRDYLVRQLVSHSPEVRDFAPEDTALLQSWASAAEVEIHRDVHFRSKTTAHHIRVAYHLNTNRFLPSDRRALRIAALIHDVGKRRGQHVSGAHGSVGARMIEQDMIPGLSAFEMLVVRLVRDHDIPGRVLKGILCPGEPGALPLSALKQADGLVWALWRADVHSIPAYAWTLELESALSGGE